MTLTHAPGTHVPGTHAPGTHALGIDLGTGSTKAVLIDDHGAQVSVASAPIPLSEPRPQWVESDPEAWWLSVQTAVRDALAPANARVGSVGLSGQMHGVVLARSDSAALRPAVISLDRRAQEDLEAYRAMSPDLFATLGNPLVPGMAGPILHWLAKNEPELLDAADWALQPKDWLRLRLVGRAGSEPSDASGTLLFDLSQSTWAVPVVGALGLSPELLAPLGSSGAVAGELCGPAAAALGLPAGIPVVYGCADTAAAMVGTGLSRVGPLQLTVGSAAQVVTLREQPRPDPQLRYHVFAAADPQRWYALAAIQVAGVALSWVLEALGATWEEAYGALEASPRGANGVSFVPHLAGARSPSMNTSARASFSNLELRHHRADMLRAVFEGVAFSIADAAVTLPEFAGASSLYLAGGGSLHPAWRQLLCDVLGKRLLVVEDPNASALGAALLGGWAAGTVEKTRGAIPLAGEVEPDPSAHGELHQGFERWQDAGNSGTDRPLANGRPLQAD
jgi:xylulokinase